ncbi:circadian clock KaiB family protein [Novipirellula caenicola]|uniref:Circadian clock protein KaiB n=1 Tax=Novipirellula caenicola TaxID=1536901 RepID=A0ABP9VVD5_9BACT
MDNRLNDQRSPVPDWDEGADAGAPHYVLRLYVTGMTPRSLRAIAQMTSICTEYLQDRHDLEIIDIYQHPSLASQDQIIASPTLVKTSPPPVTRLIGELSDRTRVLSSLGIAGSD